MDLTNYQLMALRSLRGQGWPHDLLGYLLLRCDLDEYSWTAMVNTNLVALDDNNRLFLTKLGRREYEKQKVGKYF